MRSPNLLKMLQDSETEKNRIKQLMNNYITRQTANVLGKIPYSTRKQEDPNQILVWYFISKDKDGIATVKWRLTKEDAYEGQSLAKSQGLALDKCTVGSTETTKGSHIHKQALKY